VLERLDRSRVSNNNIAESVDTLDRLLAWSICSKPRKDVTNGGVDLLLELISGDFHVSRH
jgi:hypothetical protein